MDPTTALSTYRTALELDTQWTSRFGNNKPLTPAMLSALVDAVCGYLLWEREGNEEAHGHSHSHGDGGHGHSHGDDDSEEEDEDDADDHHGHSHGDDGACEDDEHGHSHGEDSDDHHGHSHGGHGHSHGDHGHSHGDHGHSHGDDGACEDDGHGHSHGGHGHGQEDDENEDDDDYEDYDDDEEDDHHGHSHGGDDHGHSHGGHRGRRGPRPSPDQISQFMMKPLPLSEKRRLMQMLLTVRQASQPQIPTKYAAAIDAILQTERAWRGVETAPKSIVAIPDPRLVLWLGDITTLGVDCIVNAANESLAGCFRPQHPCIDNAIHSAAGPSLRDDCALLLELTADATNAGEPTGTAKATRAYNLPSRFVLHTVGPIVAGRGTGPTAEDERQLASCYTACLDLAVTLPNVHSIAFCSISTGMFGYPAEPAAAVAVRTVRAWLAAHPTSPLNRIVFDVFQASDVKHYTEALRASFEADPTVPASAIAEPSHALVATSAASESLLGAVPLALVASSMTARIAQARNWLDQADCILIAAGAGLSAAAGLDYTDQALFARLFPAMAKRGFKCMYDFIGYKNWTPALQWGYLLAQVNLARFEWPQHAVYKQLHGLVAGAKPRDHFVLTSNADGMFERNGFEPARIYTAQGDYSRMQCLRPCRPTSVWPIKPAIDRALPLIDPATQEITDPAAIPVCPNCGGPVMMNVRGGDWFLEQPHLPQRAQFVRWLERASQRRLVVLEVGAGFNTPSVVRWPCEEAVSMSPRARLIRVNRDHPEVLNALLPQAVEIALDAADAVQRLCRD